MLSFQCHEVLTVDSGFCSAILISNTYRYTVLVFPVVVVDVIYLSATLPTQWTLKQEPIARGMGALLVRVGSQGFYHLPWSPRQGRSDALFPEGLQADLGTFVFSQANEPQAGRRESSSLLH